MFEQPRYRPNSNVYRNDTPYGYREQLAEDLHQLILDLTGDNQTRVIPMLSTERQFDMAHADLDAHPEPSVGPFLDDLNRVATLLEYTHTLDLATQLAQHDPHWRHQLTPLFQALYPLLNSLYDQAQPRLAAQRLDSRHGADLAIALHHARLPGAGARVAGVAWGRGGQPGSIGDK